MLLLLLLWGCQRDWLLPAYTTTSSCCWQSDHRAPGLLLLLLLSRGLVLVLVLVCGVHLHLCNHLPPATSP